jgi:beta-lactamase class A
MRLPVAVLLLALAALPARTAAQDLPRERRDPRLEARLAELASEVRGTVGIYVRHLRTGRTAELNADSVFPTASMIKVPILAATYDAIHRGALSFDTTLTYLDSLDYTDEADILVMAEDSTRITLGRVVMLMITMSDNTAALWLQALSGGGATINEWLAANGFDSTRVNSRTPGRRPNWERHGWGQTTPREMARLLTMIRRGEAVSRGASEEMYRVLTRIYWNGVALSQLPPWVQAASKQGAVDRSRSEVVLVNAPSGDYVFAVITRNQEDTGYGPENEGYVLLRKVSALLWKTFEPKHPWTPDREAARFKE